MLPFMWAPECIPGVAGTNCKKLIVSGRRELEFHVGGLSYHCPVELLPMKITVANNPKDHIISEKNLFLFSTIAVLNTLVPF